MPKFASTLHFSSYFTLVQLLLVMGSLISVGYLPLSGMVKCVLFLGLCGYSAWNLYSHSTWQAIGQDMDGWYLKKAGQKIAVTWSGDSTVTSFVSILRFRLHGKWFKSSCIIFKDSMPVDVYRQFTVRLKYT